MTEEDKAYAQARMDGCWKAMELLMDKATKGRDSQYNFLRDAANYAYLDWRAWTQGDPKLFEPLVKGE